MKLSVVIPARNEGGSITAMLEGLTAALAQAQICSEIIVVDDGSSDETASLVEAFAETHPEVRVVTNTGRHGFGMAVRCGLSVFAGDAVAIMMADSSDSPADLVRCFRVLEQGYECVFGSRFVKGSKVIDYPPHKLIVNRLANWFIRIIFRVPFNDFTNAFKLYRCEVIKGMLPLISPHFNLTVEMPLKAIIRGFHFASVPISWTNRTTGISKLKLQEMGSRYLFIVLYLWLEKHLSRGDYHRARSVNAPVKSEIAGA